MNILRYIAYDLKQSLLNTPSFFYLLVMPVGFYLLFGAVQDYGDYPVRDGNAAAYVMLGMAVYGAVVGATSSAGGTVVEIEQGWGRQLALTPLRSSQQALAKFVNALVSTALPVLAVNIVALFTKANIPVGQQILCALMTVLAASIFAFYGTLIARLFKNARAVSVASGFIVFMAFFGTTFSPLPPDLLKIARFTPLYGVTEVSRYFFALGDTVTTDMNLPIMTEPLGYGLANLAVWACIFGLGSFLLGKRSRRR